MTQTQKYNKEIEDKEGLSPHQILLISLLWQQGVVYPVRETMGKIGIKPDSYQYGENIVSVLEGLSKEESGNLIRIFSKTVSEIGFKKL